MRARILTTVLAIALVALALVGCSPGAPDSTPSIGGEVVAVLPSGDLGAIAVEAPSPTEFEYDRASVAITPDTKLLRETSDGDTERITFADFRVGQDVDVWFEGPVAESYPVQATAGVVLVRP